MKEGELSERAIENSVTSTSVVICRRVGHSNQNSWLNLQPISGMSWRDGQTSVARLLNKINFVN